MLLAKLKAAGKRLAAANAARDAAMADVAKTVKAAHGQVPVKTIAEIVGVTRPTVYALLEK